MSQFANTASSVSFDITETAGKARAGVLSAGTATIETPNLFPVVNFYGGGRAESMFGGSTHRTIKELMIGADRVDSVDCSDYFDAAMMTVSSLTEYGISRNVLRDYLSEPIKARPVFDKFNGMLFIDSGGFQILQRGGLDGSDFQIDMDQDAVFDMQQKMGGDILVNLDRPISPEDTYEDRVAKAQQTGQDALQFADLAADHPGARYLTFHGYDYSMIDTFVSTMQDEFGDQSIHELFDGIALGGLVPKKDDRDALIDAVLGCKEVMAENGIADLPLHVLGISNGAIPLLAALGVDTFDSSSYLQSGINGKYATSLTKFINVDDADFGQCNCPVCSSDELVSRMQGNAQYRKDIMGPVAVHNYIVQQRAVERIRELIQQGETDPLIDYIDATVGREDSTRRHAHRVVNESLGGYF
ncbi:tRNA-guanine transglycosylase [Halorussus amylolyticus]|uniref:tRNA-guanine transglycosylase n=1 Tax=Halorussus amylolyticus TaxID=1126242 RepID=UPI00192FA7EA|nr:tRNA-guanine transglycosylase [Halorussus amylolyticus]